MVCICSDSLRQQQSKEKGQTENVIAQQLNRPAARLLGNWINSTKFSEAHGKSMRSRRAWAVGSETRLAVSILNNVEFENDEPGSQIGVDDFKVSGNCRAGAVLQHIVRKLSWETSTISHYQPPMAMHSFNWSPDGKYACCGCGALVTTKPATKLISVGNPKCNLWKYRPQGSLSRATSTGTFILIAAAIINAIF